MRLPASVAKPLDVALDVALDMACVRVRVMANGQAKSMTLPSCLPPESKSACRRVLTGLPHDTSTRSPLLATDGKARPASLKSSVIDTEGTPATLMVAI